MARHRAEDAPDGAVGAPGLVDQRESNRTLTAAVDTGAESAGATGLFGRGLSYVAVLSAQLISAIVISPVLAHLLPPVEFGLLASAIALHQVLVVLATMGLDQALILFRAEARNDRPAQTMIALGVVVSVFVLLVTAGTAPFWSTELGFPRMAHIVLLTLGWTVPAVVAALCGSLLLGQDRLRAFTVVVLLSGVGGQVIGVGILLVSGSRTAATYAVGNLCALLLAAIVGLVMARALWRGLADRPLVRRALTLGLPLMISSIAVFVLNAGDRLVIQRLLGAAPAGHYQIAYTVGNVAVLVLGLLSHAWAAQFAAIRDEDRRWVVIGESRDQLYKLLTPVLLGVTLGAPVLLLVVAPSSFDTPSLLVVVFLVALASLPVNAGIATSRMLLTLERSRALAVSTIVAAVVNVALNVVLVPHLELAGAALATLIAFSVQSVLQRFSLVKRITWPRTPPLVLVWGGVAAAGAAATLLLPQDTTWNLVRLGLAVACLPWFGRQLLVARAQERSRAAADGLGAVTGPAA